MSLIPPAVPTEPIAGRRRGRQARAVVGGLLVVLLVLWSGLLVAWLTLHWGILPHIQQWREPIAARVSKALGVPIAIGAIEVRTGGWVPSFELRDVVLTDPAGRPALRLPRVFAAISPRSLLALDFTFDQLLLDGPELEVRRDKAGRLHVAGFEPDRGGPGAPGDNGAADWLFSQHELVIRHGAVRWIDEQRAAPPLALTDLQLVLRNGLARHEMRLDATPPPAWGDRFALVGRFTQPLFAARGDWTRWSGEAHLDLPRADVSALARYADLPFELTRGTGAVRGWVTLQDGAPEAATVDLALRAVTARLGAGLEPLAVEAVEGRFSGRLRGATIELAVHGFAFETADALHWPRGDLRLAWRRPQDRTAEGGEFGADRLDLALMTRVAERLPLGAAARRLLADLDPRGELGGVDAHWDGPLDAPTDWRVRGRLQRGAIDGRAGPVADEPGRPGFRGADLSFDANPRGGRAKLVIDHGVLELPGVFADPLLPLDRLEAPFGWTIVPAATPGGPAAYAVDVGTARFANADAAGELSAHWRSSPPAGRDADPGRAAGPVDARFPGQLELDGSFGRADAARVARYLPLGLPAKTRAYLGQAIRGGRVASAAFHVRGALRDFPFLDASRGRHGEFRLAAHVDAVDFAFVPGAGDPAWPTLTRGEVDLRLEGRLMTFSRLKGRVAGIEVAAAESTLADLGGDPLLTVDASARAPLADLLGALNASPVSRWIDRALERTTVAGTPTPTDLQLHLALPLDRIESGTVRGSVGLVGNDLRILPGTPLVAGARGRVAFTQKGFALVGASARLFGGESSVEGGTQPDGSVRFTGQGSVTAEGLRRAPELGPVARIATAATGQARVRASLGLVRGQPDFTVTSDLVGLRIDLPAPLGKPAETPLALRVAQVVEPGAGPLRDMLRVEFGNAFQAHWLRDLAGAEPRVLRGGIGVMQPAPQPAAGVAAAVALPRFAASDWQAAAERIFGSTPGGTNATGEAGTEAGDAGANGYLPDAVTLATGELAWGTRRLTKVAATLARTGPVWRAEVTADELAGTLEYRVPPARRPGVAAAPSSAPNGRLYARLSRLVLPKEEEEPTPAAARPEDDPAATLPALDVIVDDLTLHDRRLGRVQIEATNRPGTQGRDWQLSKLEVATPEATLSATGQWTAPARGAARRTTLDFRLRVADSGALLARFGTPGAVRGGKGELAGELGWTGSPVALDLPTLSGRVAIAIDSGQFLKVEPGAARLLGVLSLQSLPRRLSLDFRDLFGQGFAFDAIQGDLAIANGIASTRNLRMRGVQAAVLMEGSADISRETEDVRVVVVPELNAGTAALAYAVINPALGLGAFLAQALLKKPLTEAGTREFRVSGPWADPRVERVARTVGDDGGGAPKAESPASGAR